MSTQADAALYLDTSAVLRAVLEQGTSPEIEHQILLASVLITSRLTLVESARALLRLRQQGTVPEAQIADAERRLQSVWSRCEIWELSAAVCALAEQVAPRQALRTLDALHLSTYLLARRRIEHLDLLTSDDRLRHAATAV